MALLCLTTHSLLSCLLALAFNKFLLLKCLLWAQDAGILFRVRYGQVVTWWLPMVATLSQVTGRSS